MATLVVSNNFSPGTPAVSGLVDANFTQIVNWSTTIDNVNLAGGAGIFASQVIPASGPQAKFGGAFGYTFAPGSAAQVPLTLSGVAGQTADLFDVTLTGGGAKALSIASTGAAMFLAGAVGVIPLTVAGVAGQTAHLFEARLTVGGTLSAYIDTSGQGFFTQGLNATFINASGNIAATTATVFASALSAVSAPVSGSIAAGDGLFQRTANSGRIGLGGATTTLVLDWNGAVANQLAISNFGVNFANFTAGTYTNGNSDQRIKNSITRLTSALSAIKKLSPSKYVFNDSGEAETGFIAQDLHAAMPDVTRTDSKGQMGYVPHSVLAYAMQGIIELEALVASLEALFAAYVAAHP